MKILHIFASKQPNSAMADRDLVRRNPPDVTTPSPPGQTYLLAIAIDEYQHCTKLSNAVLDVETFIEVLTRRYSIEAANITFIKNLEATKRRIEQALLRLIKTITPQDNLIIYFSGHGRHDEHFGGNWVPVEAGTSDDDWPDYLSNGLIKDYLSKIRSFHTFLIADSCFSGSLFIDKSKEKFSGDRRDNEPSRWGLTSGKKEIVSDGRPGHHSPFAAALLDVLRKAEQPLGVMRICDLVLEKVVANAGQTPMGSPLHIPGHQGGQMVLYFRHNEEEDWAEMQKSIAGCKTYLAKYPEGRHRPAADEIILKEEQDRAWTELMASKSIKSLYDFQQRYPKHPKVVSGKVRIELQDLEEKHLWQETLQKDTIDAYIKYKERSELKHYFQEAENAIQRIFARYEGLTELPSIPKSSPNDKLTQKKTIKIFSKTVWTTLASVFFIAIVLIISKFSTQSYEKAEFYKATDQLTIPALQTFISRFPKGKYLSQAQQKLIELEKKRDKLFNQVETVISIDPDSALILLKKAMALDSNSLRIRKMVNTIETIKAIQPDMMLIPGGTFQMGSNDEVKGINEKLAHEVRISSFYLSKYEVTVGEFKQFIDSTDYQTDADKDGGSYIWHGKGWRKTAGVNWKCDPVGKARPSTEYNHPVIHVSWNDATEYAKWLSKRTGLNYRLPTDAEWEYAAGNGSKHTQYSWGNGNPSGKQGGNVADVTANRKFDILTKGEDYDDGFLYTAPVGSFNANELGLHDMSGNVWEWCQDWYGSDYYAKSPASNPSGPTSGSLRVRRGGSWDDYPIDVRVASRYGFSPGGRGNNLGFRLARQQ